MRLIQIGRILLLGACLHAACALALPRGDDEAVAAAKRLLEQVGGEAVWQRRTLEVSEHAYLRSGEVAELRIVRDFARNARLIERRTPTQTYIEWVSPEGGWIEINGERSRMPAAELSAELYGLRQEPYWIYHGWASSSDTRVAIRDSGTTLLVYDREERLLCWFRLAANGTLRGWGNFFDGRINEHLYGPLDDMGDAHLPRWGAAMDGGFRFEYRRARLSENPFEMPR